MITRSKHARWALPVLFSLAGVLISMQFEPYLQRNTMLVFVLPVLLSAWTSGAWGGFFTSIVAVFTADYLFIGGYRSFSWAIFDQCIILAVFLALSTIVSRWVSGIRKNSERLQHILETATDGFWDWNIKTGEVYYSPRWLESLGYKVDEFPPRIEAWEELLHPDDRAKTYAALEGHFSGRNDLYEVENRLRTDSGEWRWNFNRGRVVARDRDGAPLQMVGVTIDNTTGKRAESEKTARVAAELANRAKDRFISTITHELRNPLSTIMTALYCVKSESSTPESRDFSLRVIERSVKQQMMLVEDLLNWSRLKSNKFELEMQEVNLLEIIEISWTAVEEDAANKGIVRTLEMEPGTEMLTADPRRLTQVFWNLFANAVKFTPKGGGIAIHTKLDNGSIAISIADTGIGFTESSAKSLFEPYWQEKQNESGEHGGLGLGLPIVREIVERHGGRIEAQSAGPGKGATFTVHLPYAAEQVVEVGS